jgi:hypothetical protein
MAAVNQTKSFQRSYVTELPHGGGQSDVSIFSLQCFRFQRKPFDHQLFVHFDQDTALPFIVDLLHILQILRADRDRRDFRFDFDRF